jgi:dipeptidyl aminopeptidase/acylaminoacyl peptidase
MTCAIFRRAAPLLLGLIPTRVATGQRPITTGDYSSIRIVGDPTFSPDGQQLAFTITRVDQAQNRRITSIWVAPTDATAPPRPVTGGASSSGPAWSPDGNYLSFYSTRPAPGEDGASRSQLYLLPLQGGEPRRLTSLPNGVSGCVWAPSGTRLACLSRTGPSDQRVGPAPSEVRHYTRLRYKFNDTGWFDDRKSHLWIIEVATGRATQLTSGDGWNDSSPRWSPDGSRLAFVSNRTGKEADGDGNSDVWVIPAAGGDPVRISDHADQDDTPRWSPDGRSIAFRGRERAGDPTAIYLAAAGGGVRSTVLYPGVDLSPQGMEWAETGAALYFTAETRGEAQVFRFDLASRVAQPITTGARVVRSLDVHRGSGRLAYLASDFTRPDDLFLADPDGRNERRVTSANDSLLATLTLMPVERLTYKGADGWDIEGFLVKPLGWDPGKRYPLVLSIHGGPAGMYGVGWFHEFQVYAAQGWAVFFANPRGSTGYGHRFQRGILGEWGGKDYTDIIRGVDHVLAAHSWIDPEKLGVTGGSYGGFMTNWIVGHTTRFKAAVTLRSISNFISDEGTRDGAYGHETDFGGDLFEKFELYWDRSPLKYAKNVATPILILHAENDHRVPLEQAEQWFRALRWFGKAAELVIFPRENHNLTRTGEPKHLIESLDWQVYWFSRHLDGKTEAKPPNQSR